MTFVEKANRAMTVIKKVKNLFILVLFIIHWFVVYIGYGRGHLGFTIVCSLTFLSFYLIAKALQFYWLWFISYFYLLQN